MADDAARYLGFAFASADLLFELDDQGVVGFALGAAKQVAGVDLGALTGSPWRAFIAAEDEAVVAAFLTGLDFGDRRGPIRIALKPQPGRALKRYAALSACRLPQPESRISCALTLRTLGLQAGEPQGANGLHTPEAFAAMAEGAIRQAALAGQDVNMQLVELTGLTKAAGALNQAEAKAALKRVAATLRAEALGGSAAAALTEERFAVLREGAEPAERMTERLNRAIADIGLPSVKPNLDSLSFDPEGGPGEGLKTLKVAIDRFISDGPSSAGGTLRGVIDKTVAEADWFKSAVASRRFNLAYQPVVNLKTGSTHHYEVLVRLGADDSVTEAIRMAEELDLIQDLDLAVCQSVIQELQKPTRAVLRLAANISARSLMRPAFMDRLITILRGASSVRGRLIFEITKTTAIGDVQKANAAVKRLRAEGAAVCIDGFGAGTSSFDHLRAISVDQVKIDGSYIRELASAGDRNTVMVRHLTRLCRELNVATIAEMVETDDIADILRAMGVDYAQGFLFGRPAAEPLAANRVMTPRKSAPG